MNKTTQLVKAIENGAMDDVKPDEQTQFLTAAILKEAGVTPQFLAARLKEGLLATKKVSLVETRFDVDGAVEVDMDDKPVNVRKIHEVPDHDTRHRYASTLLAFLKPPPVVSASGPVTATQVNVYPTVTDEILAIKDPQKKLKAYMDRMQAISAGVPPPEVPKERENE